MLGRLCASYTLRVPVEESPWRTSELKFTNVATRRFARFCVLLGRTIDRESAVLLWIHSVLCPIGEGISGGVAEGRNQAA